VSGATLFPLIHRRVVALTLSDFPWYLRYTLYGAFEPHRSPRTPRLETLFAAR